MFDLISLGDATIDNFVFIHDAEVKCNINKSDCMLCIEYGDKIAVDKLVHLVAGNAANNAVGGSRLKIKTAIFVNIGEDNSGKQIKDKLKTEGVDTRYVIENKGMESNLSTVINFQGERTILVYHQSWKYRLPDLEKSKWVYYTSVSHSFTETNLNGQLEQYLQRTNSKHLYNPVKKLLNGIVDLGPKMVVITDGGDGSYGFDGDNYYQIGLFPAKVLEMTGAGD